MVDDELLQKIVCVAARGEKLAKGAYRGAVMHDRVTESIGYVPVEKFEPPEFAQQLAGMLEAAADSQVLVVDRTASSLDVWSIPREVVNGVVERLVK